jgi:hypothetical protein
VPVAKSVESGRDVSGNKNGASSEVGIRTKSEQSEGVGAVSGRAAGAVHRGAVLWCGWCREKKNVFHGILHSKVHGRRIFLHFFKRSCPLHISSASVSLLKEYIIKRRYETDRASQFTGLQGLVTLTDTSTIKQSCLLSQHKECTRMPNVSDPVILLSEQQAAKYGYSLNLLAQLTVSMKKCHC